MRQNRARLSHSNQDVLLTMPLQSSDHIIVVVVGTRPEAIKMAPIVRELQNAGGLTPVVIATGQHGDLLDEMLSLFEIAPDYHLQLMRPGQSVADVSARCLSAMTPLLEEVAPSMVLVQGDTATACFSSMAAFMSHVPVGHVEAGLRTESKWRPFPEEMFRRLISTVGDLHFAPTERSRRALLRENVNEESILVTGNTVVDAIELVRASGKMLPPDWTDRIGDRALVLITMHRRESFGAPMREALRAIRELADMHADTEFVFPVHPNPVVRSAVQETLGDHTRVRLIEPVSYPVLLALLERATCVLTDSGGIQEEAPSFGVPAVVLREETERMEGVEAGVAYCTGTDRARIVERVNAVLKRPREARVERWSNPYGDGHAARRIVSAVRLWIGAPRAGVPRRESAA